MADPLAIKPGLGNPLSFSMCFPFKPSMARSEISQFAMEMTPEDRSAALDQGMMFDDQSMMPQ